MDELTNTDRADRAHAALAAYCAPDGQDRSVDPDRKTADEVISDLLCDLCHYLTQAFGEVDPEESLVEQLGRGARHYVTEVAEELPADHDPVLDGPVVPETATCSWYALCDRPAAGVVAHPVLGNVPTCERCADRHELQLVRGEVVVDAG